MPVIIIHKFYITLFPVELRVLRTQLKNECVTDAIVLCHMMKAALRSPGGTLKLKLGGDDVYR